MCLSDFYPGSIVEDLNACDRMDLPCGAPPRPNTTVTTMGVVIEEPAIDTDSRRSPLHRPAVPIPVAGEWPEIGGRPRRNGFAKPGRQFGDDDLIPSRFRITLIG